MTVGEFHYMVRTVAEVPRGIRERHGIVQLDLSQPRVSIYCRERSHEDDPWFVASFRRTAKANEDPRWVASHYYPTDDGCGFWIGDGVISPLVGDQVMTEDPMSYAPESPGRPASGAPLGDPGFRVRYALPCGLCDYRLTRKSDELNGDLERLWSAGVFEVSIRGLAAIVR